MTFYIFIIVKNLLVINIQIFLIFVFIDKQIN